ncbi:MAG TPA: T9SS type A sorting domain-containing protein [Bacteroidales bacterium]|nr:T9SS type A sorting domain-containing protein [Bacteroidales bacterium]HRZ49076.1 T9SS type A sorting domain-containing protein [Bacteroidales bacterium]
MHTKIKLLWVFWLIFGFAYTADCQVTGWQWARTSGGTGRDEAELPAVDPDGNVIICGKFSDTAWFGTSFLKSSGMMDMYIAKYSKTGTFIWAAKGGSALDAEALSVAADHAGNIAVTGYYKGTLTIDTVVLPGISGKESFFIAKYDAAGQLLWARSATGGNIRGKGIEFDPFGNVLVTGHYEDSAQFGNTTIHSAGLQNAFLAKYSAAGQLQWATYGGGQYNAWASSVGVDSQGNSYITGAFKDTAWFGTHQIITYGVNDVFLAKCSPAGTWIWATHAGGTSDDYGNGIEVDAYDHIAVTGSFFLTVNFPPAPAITSYGAKDGFAAYYDPAGNCEWSLPFGGVSDDKGIGISCDNVGNVYVTGFIKNQGNFGPILLTGAGVDDVSLAKYTRTGSILWAVLAGGTNNDYGKGIQVYKQGLVYIAGVYNGTAQFGNSNTLVSKGLQDSYVALYHDGTPLITQQPLSQNLCVGDSLILEVAATGGGTGCAWYRNGAQIMGQNATKLSLYCADTLLTGKYTCMVLGLSGYAISDTAYINVYTNPVVDLGIDTVIFVMLSDSLNLNAGSGFAGYHWSNGDTTAVISCTAGDIFPFFAPSGKGYLVVEVFSASGCSAKDSVWVEYSLSVNDPSGQTIAVDLLPNPTRGMVRLLCSEPVVYAEIHTLTGQRKLWSVAGSGEKEFAISLSDFPAGLYLITIQTEKGRVVKRLIRE